MTIAMTDDLDSSSRGIWVFPHTPSEEGEAGPSRPRRSRPLKGIYESSLQAYRATYEAYEDERGENQLDDITDWLHSEPGESTKFHRVPVAILQNPGKKVHAQLGSVIGHDRSIVVGVQGRDITDLGSGVRAIVTGILPEVTKSGMTGLDLVEDWWKGRKNSPTIILHIQEAQVIPPSTLAEILYIISLHRTIPFRVLISVPSTSTFLSQWQLLEPSSVDLTILLRGTSSGKRNALTSILETAKSKARITVSDALAEELKRVEIMFGGQAGHGGALKSIQWAMLHHSANSPLSSLATDASGEQLSAIQAILEATSSNSDSKIPGRELFELPLNSDLRSVTDPSPRISILQALGNTSSFTSHLSRPNTQPNEPAEIEVEGSPETPKKRKSRHVPTEPIERDTEEDEKKTDGHEKGDLADLEVLYNLWKGSGKTVNLWDWLQGYKNHITGAGDEDENEGDQEKESVEADDKGKEKERESGKRKREEEVDEDQIHASFVRFCEEARMLGMVRARGKAVGRKADEVVKGVTLL